MLREAVAGREPVLPLRSSIAALSAARSNLILEGDRPISIVGERINPTGKKALQQELLEGKMSLVRTMAKEQEKMGASLLDVNVGMPGIDEKETMLSVIENLSIISDLPLVIDSSDSDVIEAALRLYPGRALINSISGEKAKLEKLLPVAAKYGAMFILLPLTEGDIPETAEKRKKIIEYVFEKAATLGFTKADIVVDGLVMAASSDFKAPLETLKTIEWGSNLFKVNTVLGLSNVSFGMPERKWLNASFLAMAISKGLTMAIANPGVEEVMKAKMAGDVLVGRDRDAAGYIGYFSGLSSRTGETSCKVPEDKVSRAILEGNRDDIEQRISDAINSGMDAQKLVDEIMIPAITEVGELFDRREYFLPQLIASAETMKKGIAFLEPRLGDTRQKQKLKGRVIIATVKGDVHDIGKNIVVLMLRNHGFEVIDLGKDVPADIIVREAARHKSSVVGLSALMTTTMSGMKEVIALAEQESLGCAFMVGGAVVTRAYAESIGAHYARDGVEAVKIVEKLTR